MKPFSFRSLILLAVLSIAGPLSFAQDESAQPELSDEERAAKAKETVALARSFLGNPDKLDAIKSIKMKGVLVYGSGQSGTVESVFKSPNYHQFISVIGGNRETSTLNRSEAWRKLENLQAPGAYQLTFYEPDDIRHLEATVIDTLSFLETPATRNGRIEYLGMSEIAGQEAIMLLYVHNNRIWFRRYIHPETGQVLHMVNDKGVIFSYEGTIEVDGVKFPEKTIVRVVTQFGEQTMEISYSDISLNEEVDTDRFRVPQG
ncbi:hypothetical protein [Pelagicoccus mobilis]|uniref:Outer membrane lipoprotein-sorting protein n=1 Tax=Pelagicoccus mobilis TaxID=415221 RepID=A0A934RZ02_9BACT|nr:hypothetical protein [Pelagicoccus mobilis]MBK1877874.1 hypothetical protein [Pelagicoccus mobilis]